MFSYFTFFSLPHNILWRFNLHLMILNNLCLVLHYKWKIYRHFSEPLKLLFNLNFWLFFRSQFLSQNGERSLRFDESLSATKAQINRQSCQACAWYDIPYFWSNYFCFWGNRCSSSNCCDHDKQVHAFAQAH